MNSRGTGLLVFIMTIFMALAANAEDVIDVRKGALLLNTNLKNLNGDSIHGDAALLQAIVSYKANERANKPLTLHFPDGIYRLDTTVYIGSNITLLFSKNARVISTSKMAQGSNVLETIGSSRVRVLNMKYSNYQSGYLNAVVQFKASPNKCTGNQVIGCSFRNIWASSGIMLAYIGDDDDNYWLANTLLENDTIINNFNPSYPHILSGDDYHTDRDCSGIDIVNANKYLRITGCYIVNTGGAGIEGLGLSKKFSHQPEAGRVEVDNNFIRFSNMNIEINGTYALNGLSIHNNRLYYPGYAGGFNISAEGKPLSVKNNYCYSANNGNLELSFYGGECSGNRCYIVMWKNASQGFNHGAYTKGSSRIGGVHIYGFMADVHDNLFSADPSGKSASSPDELMGVALMGPAANGDTAYDRNSYGTLKGLAGGHRIHNNIFIGQTNRLLDNSMSENQKIVFVDNNISTANLLPGDALFWIKGNNYLIKNNLINISGSRAPANGQGIIYKLAGFHSEIVQDNIIIGGSSRAANNKNYKFILR